MNKARLNYFIFFLVIALAFSACNSKSEAGKQAVKPAVEKPVPVVTARIEVKPVQRTVDFVGTLEAYEEAAVASNVEAQVAKVYVDMGDRVSAGRPLVKLDPEEFKIKVDLADSSLKEAQAKLGGKDEDGLNVEDVSYVKKAKADLDDAELNLKRMKDLQAKGYVSRSQLDDAQSRRDMAKAALDTEMENARSNASTIKTRRASLNLARKQARDTDVRAPISGFVSKRSVDPGDYAKVGTELIRIVSIDPIRLRGEVPEVYAPDVKIGKEVKVKFAAVPGKEYSGSICRISPSSSPQSRSFLIEVRIPNSSAVLKPGYFAEASVLTKMDKSALMVPVNSIVSFAGISKIFVLEGGKAYEKIITPGVRSGDLMEVSGEGIKAGDEVVVTGLKSLYNGKTVLVRN